MIIEKDILRLSVISGDSLFIGCYKYEGDRTCHSGAQMADRLREAALRNNVITSVNQPALLALEKELDLKRHSQRDKLGVLQPAAQWVADMEQPHVNVEFAYYNNGLPVNFLDMHSWFLRNRDTIDRITHVENGVVQPINDERRKKLQKRGLN